MWSHVNHGQAAQGLVPVESPHGDVLHRCSSSCSLVSLAVFIVAEMQFDAFLVQAKIPKGFKERLQPWQIDGVRHLFETIILDHDSEMWRKHQQEQAAARRAQGTTGTSPEAINAPLHAGGSILAHV